jgi:hypothetical protein
MDAGVTCASLGFSPAPSPNPQRVQYFIQTGTTQQVNEWCTNKSNPSGTNGGTFVYINYIEAPLTPPTTYTIYKNASGNDGTLFYTSSSEFLPFVLFGGPNTTVNWKGSISPSSVIGDWTQCDTPVPSLSMTPSMTPTPPPSTEPTYLTSRGSRWECDNGTVYQYDIYENTNSYFTGNQFSNGTSGTQTFDTQTFNSMLTSAPSTTPNWVNSGSPYCSRGVQYQLKINNNPCSSTYNTTDAVVTGNNSTCWQISDVYYLTCADAKSLSNPYQSFVLNDTYKYFLNGANPTEWEDAGLTMQGEWFFNDQTGSHQRIFNDDGTIRNTDTAECVVGGGGGGDPLPPG